MKFVGQRIERVGARTGHVDMLFYSCNLDLDPMTLIYIFDLDSEDVAVHQKMTVFSQNIQ